MHFHHFSLVLFFSPLFILPRTLSTLRLLWGKLMVSADHRKILIAAAGPIRSSVVDAG